MPTVAKRLPVTQMTLFVVPSSLIEGNKVLESSAATIEKTKVTRPP
jgi:hypothetical protein